MYGLWPLSCSNSRVSSCDRDCTAHKGKNIYSPALQRKMPCSSFLWAPTTLQPSVEGKYFHSQAPREAASQTVLTYWWRQDLLPQGHWPCCLDNGCTHSVRADHLHGGWASDFVQKDNGDNIEPIRFTPFESLKEAAESKKQKQQGTRRGADSEISWATLTVRTERWRQGQAAAQASSGGFSQLRGRDFPPSSSSKSISSVPPPPGHWDIRRPSLVFTISDKKNQKISVVMHPPPKQCKTN